MAKVGGTKEEKSMSGSDTQQPRSVGKGRGKGIIPQFPVLKLPQETRIHYTPWLLVRSAVGDFGTRPLPGGATFWESPDVWVTSSLGVNQPVPGEDNTVFARVTNLGREQANGVVVKFWWANPSLAITETSAHLIGIGFADIPALRSQIVKCPTPWVPVEENGGHECLLAEAYVPNFDPLTAPMDPVLDRHVGQKNEQLIIVARGKKFSVKLSAANVSPLDLRVVFDVYPLRMASVPRLIEVRTEHRRQTVLPPTSQLPLRLDFHEGSHSYVPTSEFFARRLLSFSEAETAGPTVNCLPVPLISKSQHLEAWESRVLEVSGEVPKDAPIGQTFLFRVVQRTGPIVAGGYTVAVLVGNP
jgi:hypothetical protein